MYFFTEAFCVLARANGSPEKADLLFILEVLYLIGKRFNCFPIILDDGEAGKFRFTLEEDFKIICSFDKRNIVIENKEALLGHPDLLNLADALNYCIGSVWDKKPKVVPKEFFDELKKELEGVSPLLDKPEY
ncbi:MAG: hypothetical protein NTV62_03875 [Candidatus Gribaldobacteria bacterium]|nr:hypothetical protein [Candidatus Gribaldobacteria bacterium]